MIATVELPTKHSAGILPALLMLLLAAATTAHAQQPQSPARNTTAAEKQREGEGKTPASSDAGQRTDLNLLGKTDTTSGESRRNENVQFNLVDNNALKELNVRLGTTATIVQEFSPANNYFGSEFGNAPRSAITLPSSLKSGFHGTMYATHLNSIFSARTFFQVGSVKPARENDYGFNFGLSLSPDVKLFADAGQQKVRGIVNGNVLVPKPDERTPLTTDPALRTIITRFLSAYPAELPNRTDINPRALNTNAPQSIDGDRANLRLDQQLNPRDSLAWQYQHTSQSVDAFQFVAGQNPNTDTKSHLARMVWTRQWNTTTISYLSASYDRVTSLLQPDEETVGPFILIAGLTGLGPDGAIPIDRAQNNLRYAGQVRRLQGAHNFSGGFTLVRRQLNGRETDVHRGFFSFNNDFLDAQGRPRDAITNLRLGTPSQFLLAVGNVNRGFRSWELQFYAGDNWRVTPRLNLQYGLRWQPATAPTEVNHLSVIAYDSDWNNLAPQFGFAFRLPKQWGIARAAYGVQFGEIFPVTYQQVRFSPPNNRKGVQTAPDLVASVAAIGGVAPNSPTTFYQLDSALATPYSHQYNLSWEPEWNKQVRLQFGYVGSRSHKLLVMWYLNRAHTVPGIESTTKNINDRRTDTSIADARLVVNGSRGFYDAGRVSLILSSWRGLTLDASYWFSKAMDLGASYTNTANENDARKARSQSEFETHRDMRGLSDFDQTHAFLLRTSYTMTLPGATGLLNRIASGWNLSSIILVKSGTPFNLSTGSDAPGFGNVDGNGGDRPNLLDPSILGRTIANPDTSRQLLPRSAFTFIAKNSEQGNLGRNVFRKGPIRNVNATLSRVWAIHKDVRLTFKAESINLFNTPQFAEPGFELANPNFGQITNTLNDGRTFRFGLQIGW